jgi:5-bromo-4-chloroindolyl phosphate hydrolysis protein
MDIVKRLRETNLSTANSDYNANIVGANMQEAADEIERLRDAIIKIRTITNVDWVEDMDKHDTDINEIIKEALGG